MIFVLQRVLIEVLILGSAGRKWQKEDKSITCYDCNSLYDPRCADPFDPYSLGYVNCSLRDIPEHLKDKYSRSVLCRKTVQKGKKFGKLC